MSTTSALSFSTEQVRGWNRGLVTFRELIESTRGQGEEAGVLLVVARDIPNRLTDAEHYFRTGDWPLSFYREYPQADPFYVYQGMVEAGPEVIGGHRFIRVVVPCGEVLTIEFSYAETLDRVADSLRAAGYQTSVTEVLPGALWTLAAFRAEKH